MKSVWKDNDFYVVNKDESGNLHNVFVLNPGQLTDEIAVDNFQTVKVLTVSGNLNGTDIAAINEMTSLRYLDMRQANIVEGGEAYSGNLKTENNVFGDDFFRNMKNLSTIILPESVKSIGSCVINTCIKSVIIPDGIIEIGNYAFSGCSSLSSIEIPNSVTTIGESAFSGCSSLSSTEIPQNITVIGESAFKDCLSLTSVIILDGNNELNIRESAFDGCKLNEMYWGRNLDKGCYGMPLGFKESLLKVTIGRDVTRIIPYAFRGCSSLKSVI